RRFLRLRFFPSERLCRRPAFPALILPVPVMRKRFTALRFVFNFGILQILPGRASSARERRVVHAPPSCVKPSAPRRGGPRERAAAAPRGRTRRRQAGWAAGEPAGGAGRQPSEPWRAGTAASGGSARGS